MLKRARKRELERIMRVPMVYIIRSGEYIKVGHTRKGYYERHQFYFTCNPDFTLVAVMVMANSDESKTLEREYHARLKPWSHRTEWFKDVPEGIMQTFVMGERDELVYRAILEAIAQEE
jgi:hypothetical protein